MRIEINLNPDTQNEVDDLLLSAAYGLLLGSGGLAVLAPFLLG